MVEKIPGKQSIDIKIFAALCLRARKRIYFEADFYTDRKMEVPTTTADLLIKTVAYQSTAYQQLVQLRYEVLRVPLGLTFTADFLAKDAADILIGAFEEEEAIGCCQLTPHPKSVFQLRQMAVAGKRQGGGIGARLIQYAEEVARQNGGTQIRLHAREVAADFYKKLGYTPIGDPFTEIGLPHLEMVKNV